VCEYASDGCHVTVPDSLQQMIDLACVLASGPSARIFWVWEMQRARRKRNRGRIREKNLGKATVSCVSVCVEERNGGKVTGGDGTRE